MTQNQTGYGWAAASASAGQAAMSRSRRGSRWWLGWEDDGGQVSLKWRGQGDAGLMVASCPNPSSTSRNHSVQDSVCLLAGTSNCAIRRLAECLHDSSNLLHTSVHQLRLSIPFFVTAKRCFYDGSPGWMRSSSSSSRLRSSRSRTAPVGRILEQSGSSGTWIGDVSMGNTRAKCAGCWLALELGMIAHTLNVCLFV